MQHVSDQSLAMHSGQTDPLQKNTNKITCALAFIVKKHYLCRRIYNKGVVQED